MCEGRIAAEAEEYPRAPSAVLFGGVDVIERVRLFTQLHNMPAEDDATVVSHEVRIRSKA